MQCQPVISIEWSPSNVPSGLYRKLFFRRSTGLKVGESLPGLTCECANVQVDADNLNAYRLVIEQTKDAKVSDPVPLFYPHALFGSAHLLMISHRQFPLSASGLLHLRNHVIQRRPFSIAEPWGMRCELTRQRVVEKGIEFDFDSTVTVGGSVVWESVSTYLKRQRTQSKQGGEQDWEESPLADLFPAFDSAAVAGSFAVPHNIGKRYAKVTGDYNPIHVSSLAAKLFGFKRAIAHGMWSVARAIPELPQVVGTLRHDVAFKGPMLVKSQAELKQGEDGRFDIFCGKNPRPVIVGVYRTAADSETLI